MTQTAPLLPPPIPNAQDDEELCLMGATRLGDFVDFVRSKAVNGLAMNKGELAEKWRAAAGVYETLQTTDANGADRPNMRPIPASMQPHIDQLTQIASFQSTFSTVPVSFAMVELGKLVVYQHHLTQSTLNAMAQDWPTPMTDRSLIELCLPLKAGGGELKLLMKNDKQAVFSASNHDGRFLGAHLIEPSSVSGLVTDGHPQTVLALAFGFTTNVLNLVRYGDRMVLNNGYHRAFAMLRRGITHAPCLIQVCEHWEDVGMVGSSEMSNNGDVYFSRSRPPILRDFGNPQLTERFHTLKTRKQIKVSFEVETTPMWT